VGLVHQRYEQREVERVGPEVPARFQPDPLVGLADGSALLEVGVVDGRIRESEQVVALCAHEPHSDRWVAEELTCRGKRKQAVVEGVHHFVGVLRDQRL